MEQRGAAGCIFSSLMPGVGQQKDTLNTSPLSYVVALCSAQVCVPPPAISVWPFFEGGVCGEGVQVFAIISALRGTECG